MKIASFVMALLVLNGSVYSDEGPHETAPTEQSAAVENADGLALLKTVEPVVELGSTEENFMLHLPSDMLRLADQEQVTRSFPVAQCISGSRVRGTGELSGTYTQELEEDADGATWQVDFSGVSHTKTRASQNRVTSFQRGLLDFHSQGNITYSFAGFVTEGISTSGHLTTRRTGIRMPYRGLRRRIAMRRMNERSGSDRRIAERLGVRDLADSFRAELTGRVAELNAQYQERVVAPLRHNGIYPSISRVNSQTDSIHLALRFDGQHQPEMQVPMTDFHTGDQLRLAVHESAINNAARGLHGKKRSLSHTLRGQFSAADEHNVEGQDLQIEFATAQPLEVSFSGETMNIALRGDSFENAGQAYGAMEIAFAYRLEYRAGEQHLVLVGEPNVQHPAATDGSRPKMGLRDLSLRRVLMSVLQRELPASLAVAQQQFPLQLDLLQPSRLDRIKCDNGWLVLEAVRDVSGEEEVPQVAMGTAGK